MDIILSASIIAAFVSGMIALFAPCCITVLLPAYLASAFREKKHLLRMTLVFFAGIATILVPIGLGAAGLAEVFRNFHSPLYIVGGAFMIVLAVLSVLGKGMSIIPFMDRLKPDMRAMHTKSVYGLGILSGAATSCCAPVLAGAMALAVLSGAFWKAIVVTFAYVFGMTFPLFLTAYFYDRFKLDQTRLIRGRVLEFHAGAKKVFVHSTNLIAGIIFLGMGLLMVWLGANGDAYWSPEAQAHLGKNLTHWSGGFLEKISVVPDVAWGLLIIAAFAYIVYRVVRNRSHHNDEHTSERCH
jgi:cytochrome c-type biogenesis protein